jgi:membrane protein YdbS with pleckstrin-like domain
MGFGLHPLILIAAVTLIGAVACLVFAYFASHWLKRGILIVAALFLLCPSGVALICFKPELVDDRFKIYKQLFGDIEVGMSRAEVMTLVDQHYPSEG